MKNMHKSHSEEAWEDKKLGASEKHVRKASSDAEKKLDSALGLKAISIRLPKHLIDELKDLAEKDGIGYQPYIRLILTRYARDEKMHRSRQVKRYG